MKIILLIVIIAALVIGVKFVVIQNSSRINQTNNAVPNYAVYVSGSELHNSGIKINLPQGWTGKTKEDSADVNGEKINQINFYLYPPNYQQSQNPSEGSFWDGIPFRVYPMEISIESFISKYYPTYKEKLIVEEGKIGNMKSYNLKPDPKKYTGEWAYREVVLGKNHAYEVGYYNGGSPESHKTIVSEVYPNIIFE